MKTRSVLALVAGWALLAMPAGAEDKEKPFELEVILSDYQRRLDEGTIKLAQATIEELEEVKGKYLRADRVDDALAVAKAIKSLEGRIEEIKKRREERTGAGRGPKVVNDLRRMVLDGKWVRVGTRAGIGRSIYTLKPDGTAEGFILGANDRPGKKTAWDSWDLRGKELQLGTETFTYDEEKGRFVGSLSELRRQPKQE